MMGEYERGMTSCAVEHEPWRNNAIARLILARRHVTTLIVRINVYMCITLVKIYNDETEKK